MCKAVQVLWGQKLILFLGAPFRKKEYKIRYESEYLFRAPPGAIEGP